MVGMMPALVQTVWFVGEPLLHSTGVPWNVSDFSCYFLACVVFGGLFDAFCVQQNFYKPSKYNIVKAKILKKNGDFKVRPSPHPTKIKEKINLLSS